VDLAGGGASRCKLGAAFGAKLGDRIGGGGRGGAWRDGPRALYRYAFQVVGNLGVEPFALVFT
jgi:hypothetical protein